MVDHSDKKKQYMQNVMLMILEGATRQVQVVVSYIPIYSFGKVFIMFVSICQTTCTYFEGVFIKISSKMTVATKLWTL